MNLLSSDHTVSPSLEWLLRTNVSMPSAFDAKTTEGLSWSFTDTDYLPPPPPKNTQAMSFHKNTIRPMEDSLLCTDKARVRHVSWPVVDQQLLLCPALQLSQKKSMATKRTIQPLGDYYQLPNRQQLYLPSQFHPFHHFGLLHNNLHLWRRLLPCLDLLSSGLPTDLVLYFNTGIIDDDRRPLVSSSSRGNDSRPLTRARHSNKALPASSHINCFHCYPIERNLMSIPTRRLVEFKITTTTITAVMTKVDQDDGPWSKPVSLPIAFLPSSRLLFHNNVRTARRWPTLRRPSTHKRSIGPSSIVMAISLPSSRGRPRYAILGALNDMLDWTVEPDSTIDLSTLRRHLFRGSRLPPQFIAL